MRKLRFTQNHITGNSRLCQALSLLLAFFFTIGASSVNAQCAMTCNDDVNISLPGPAEGCEITITPDLVLQNPAACAGPYTIIVMDMQGNEIPNSPHINEDYIGQTLMYNVIDQTTNNSCWGQMDIEDKLGPTFDCSSVTVYCVEDTSPMSATQPTIEDCSGDMTSFQIDHFDSITDGDCTDAYSTLINRTWVATDEFGNTTTCIQTITVERVSLVDFTPECPVNVTLQCSMDSQPSTAPADTGYPYFVINGIDYDIVPGADNFCELASSYSDEEFDLCGGGRKILRTWTVYDWCVSTDLDENPYTCIQVIKIEDNEAPVVECPEPFSVSTASAGCLATFVIPTPLNIEDGCSSVETFVITPIGIRQVGDVITLGLGDHTLTYVATDQCGNSSSCTVEVTIMDDTPPVAVCDEFTIVALTGDGYALIAAEVFDDGSDDNCSIDHFVARRMNGDCSGGEDDFGEHVQFCCSDIGENVMVIFRVFDNADNYNECMVEVEVQDKIDPTIVCPPNKLVECVDAVVNLNDLSPHGTALGLDNCSEVEITEEYEDLRTTCGVGEILRTFTATDPSGRTATCEQVLTVTNSDPFDISTVSWPADYETSECGAMVDPEDLPASPVNYSMPAYTSNSCDLIAVTHEDTYLPVNPPACYKILRKWIIINWCEYNPNDDDPQGYAEWTQVVKVSDYDAPEFSCPDALSFTSLSPDCGNTEITVEPFTATDCSTDVDFSYEIDLNADGTTDIYANGNDISGSYPVGEHSVRIIASDGCGNLGSCEFPLTINDGKAPTALCLNGLAVELMPMNGGGMIEVQAATMDYGSTDNCTAQEDLELVLTPNMFNCSNLGTNVVTLTVIDEAGNFAECQTYIIVQDNMGLCATGSGGTQIIAGAIISEMGTAMEGVNIAISGNGPTATPLTTDSEGQFHFEDLQAGYDYTVQPNYTGNWTTGVTTFDLVLIKRHVLNIERLDSPYKIIAADANKSNAVTTSDIVTLRRMILGIDTEFPNGNTSYRFVDASYSFPNLEDPFASGFPEVYNINNLSTNMMNVDFKVIKVGDVNNSNGFGTESGEERNANSLSLEMNDMDLVAGQTYSVAVRANDFEDVFGYQFALEFDADNLEFIELNPNEANDLTEQNFGLAKINRGIIAVSWDKTENTLYNTNTLFNITFKAKKNTTISNVIQLNNEMLKSEAYKGANDDIYDLELNFGSQEVAFELYQNQPNPFSEVTNISFNLPSAGAATLTLFDLDGKVLKTLKGNYAQGVNTIEIRRDEMNANKGVIIYQLETAEFTATRKMILL